MKLWSVPVIAAFVLVIFLSLLPLGMMSFGPERGARAANAMSRNAWFIGWVVTMAICQGVLLIRVAPSENRPRARRKLLPAIIATSLCLSLLLTMVLLMLPLGIKGDRTLNVAFDVSRSVYPFKSELLLPLTLVGFVIAQWVVWTVLLQKYADPANPGHFMARLTRWLVAGSVAELVVAVPCHVLARKRDDCCAPLVTFWGIVTGISILLLCLGPAVMYLVQDRLRKKGLKG